MPSSLPSAGTSAPPTPGDTATDAPATGPTVAACVVPGGPGVHAQLEHVVTRFLRRALLPTSGDTVRREAEVPIEWAAYIALVRVGELDGGRLSDLAERLGLDASTTSRHVRRLTDTGLVEVRSDPADGRARRLHLTAAGQQLIDRVRDVRCARLARVLHDWTPDEIARLATDLHRLLTAFEAEDRA